MKQWYLASSLLSQYKIGAAIVLGEVYEVSPVCFRAINTLSGRELGVYSNQEDAQEAVEISVEDSIGRL